MHNGALKKWALALTFWLALHVSSLKAQIFTNDLPLQAVTTGSNPVDFEFRSDGTLIAKGNFGIGSLGSGDQGDGTRLLWFPSIGALRAGTVSTGLSLGDGPWDSGRMGNNSVAFGYNNTALGDNSVAMGNNSNAYGANSLVFGNNSEAGVDSSIALGGYVTAGASNAIAFGSLTYAGGYCSVAMGNNTIASGGSSTASGGYTTASGYAASAAGSSTTASSYVDFVIGAFNVGGGTANTWVATDPLFEIGNGGSSSGYGNPALTGPADALVVYKNGNAVLQGTLQVAPGGDIPMFTGE